MTLFGWRRPDLTRLPSEVIRQNGVVIGAEGDDPFVRTNFEHLGTGSVVWASDYPHRDARFPGTTEELLERKDLDEDGRAALAGGNAARFYGLRSLASTPSAS
jgi:predicted TIM-barrel fold metal-dependent hydrolase